jgi:IS30 family transposase
MVSKTSKYLIAGLAKNKIMEEFDRVTIKLLGKVEPAHLKTMTLENGRGFCGHEKLSKTLNLKCFFANLYHSWELRASR